MRLKLALIWPFLACLLVPLIAAWFAYPVDHQPPKFGAFPPEQIPGAPGFNLLVFCLIGLVCLVITALLLYPSLFGFKPVTPPAPVPTIKLPFWFWIGTVLTVFFWWLMWARVTAFGDLVYYAFSPMWWGFILALDGLTYSRSGGNSFLASKPKTFLICALVSVAGWLFFEYFDYFVLSNWYYPNGHMAALSHATIVSLFLIAYTTVWPAIFEWYTLLMTFPALSVKYSDGPKLALPGNLMLWGGLALIAATVFFPYPLFWAMWVGPLIVLAGQLVRKNIWTPFTAMAQGNWSPILLVAISSLCNGIFWEMWNHGSENINPISHVVPPFATNPNYWIYDVPYVNVIHLFSEMPLLGYFGYLPFGILVWVFFIWTGKLFGFSSDFGNIKYPPASEQ
jgi:hypothetical protein